MKKGTAEFVKREKQNYDRGFGQTVMVEDNPIYIRAQADHIIHNNNSYIVLCKDRPSSTTSGEGAKGIPNVSSIDMVVGRHSSFVGGTPDSSIAVHPNFFSDAARIYITQRGDVDSYFGLAKGSEEGAGSAKRSGAAIKADHVRIVGTNHVKIVAGRGKINRPGIAGEKNSQGGDIEVSSKIDLIAGNFTEDRTSFGLPIFSSIGPPMNEKIKNLQPIPKGNNLVDSLKDLVDQLEDVILNVKSNADDISKLYSLIGGHHHEIIVPTPTGAFIAAPSVIFTQALAPLAGAAYTRGIELKLQSKNLGFFRLNYLEDVGYKYINSKFVNTT